MPSPKTTTRAKAYGKAWADNKFTDLAVPSGALCQVRRPGVNGLLKAGVLESFDSLTAIVDQVTIPTAEGRGGIDVKKIVSEPDVVSKMMDQLDKVVMYVVVQPKLHPIDFVTDEDGEYVLQESPAPGATELRIPLTPTNRNEEFVYLDDIDEMDKTFIMNFAMGGSSDLERFRQESEEALGGVPDVAEPAPTPE